MKKKILTTIIVSMFLFPLLFASPDKSVAEPGKSSVMHKGKGMKGMSGHSAKKYSEKSYKKGKHKMGHLFGPQWKHTLTDEQKMEADRLHLSLKKKTSILYARLGVVKIELKNLITEDTPDMNGIDKKIDEMMEAKKSIKKEKFRHKVEMRRLLTPEQRVSFDMGILSMDRHKRKKGH